MNRAVRWAESNALLSLLGLLLLVRTWTSAPQSCTESAAIPAPQAGWVLVFSRLHCTGLLRTSPKPF